MIRCDIHSFGALAARMRIMWKIRQTPIRLTLECFGFTSAILSVCCFCLSLEYFAGAEKFCSVEWIPCHLNGSCSLSSLFSFHHVMWFTFQSNATFSVRFFNLLSRCQCQAAGAICFWPRKTATPTLKCNFSPEKDSKDVTRTRTVQTLIKLYVNTVEPPTELPRRWHAIIRVRKSV